MRGAMQKAVEDIVGTDDVVNLVLKLPPDQLVAAYEFLLFLQTKHRPRMSQRSTVLTNQNQAEFTHASEQDAMINAFAASGIHVSSPRLVHRDQAADFQLEVIEEGVDAGV
jgi:hypothetical protein